MLDRQTHHPASDVRLQTQASQLIVIISGKARPTNPSPNVRCLLANTSFTMHHYHFWEGQTNKPHPMSGVCSLNYSHTRHAYVSALFTTAILIMQTGVHSVYYSHTHHMARRREGKTSNWHTQVELKTLVHTMASKHYHSLALKSYCYQYSCDNLDKNFMLHFDDKHLKLCSYKHKTRIFIVNHMFRNYPLYYYY